MGNVKYVTGLNLVVTQLCAVGNRPKFHSFKDQAPVQLVSIHYKPAYNSFNSYI